MLWGHTNIKKRTQGGEGVYNNDALRYLWEGSLGVSVTYKQGRHI